MPWKLFRQLGLYGGAYAGFVSPKDCSSMELDPVECVGVIRLKDLKGSVMARRSELSFCETALEILLTEDSEALWRDVSLWDGASAESKRDDRTSEKWRQHISTLSTKLTRTVPLKKHDTIHKLVARWGVLESQLLELNPSLARFAKGYIRDITDVIIPWEPILLPSSYGELRHIGKYFAVPKTEEIARAIWNGKSLSEKSLTPPPVFLPYLPEMLKKIGALSKNFPEGMSMYTGDFRHFFHQIPVGKRLSTYFGVSLGGRFFRWRTLPMGWSFSPYCAQSVAWAVLLHCPGGHANGGHDPDFVIPKDLKKLPTYIDLHDGGFITVYYDNSILFCAHLKPSVTG